MKFIGIVNVLMIIVDIIIYIIAMLNRDKSAKLKQKKEEPGDFIFSAQFETKFFRKAQIYNKCAIGTHILAFFMSLYTASIINEYNNYYDTYIDAKLFSDLLDIPGEGTLVFYVILSMLLTMLGLFFGGQQIMYNGVNDAVEYACLLIDDEKLFAGNPGQSGFLLSLDAIEAVTVSDYIDKTTRRKLCDKIEFHKKDNKGKFQCYGVIGVQNAHQFKTIIEQKVKEAKEKKEKVNPA